jgi:hypothetical protein
MTESQQKKQILHAWQADPLVCNKQLFDNANILWPKQQEVLKSIWANKRTAVKSGNSVGKSRLAATATLCWLASHKPAKVITTAPTFNQIEGIIWKEIAGLYRQTRFPFGGKLINTELSLASDWFAVGISTNDVNRFQGYHCFDEATEILTKRGWQTIDTIRQQDLVLSVPVGSRESEWKPIGAIHKYPFDGLLNVYDSKVTSFAVTDEHRFPTKYDNTPGKWALKRFSELKTKFLIQRKLSWRGDKLTVPKEFKEFTDKEFAEFIGFWTGDGGTRTHSQTGICYEVLLYQLKPEGQEYVKQLIKKLKWTKAQDYFSISDKAKVKWLIDNIGRYQPDRVVPRCVLDANLEIISAYVDGLWKADGSFKNGVKRQFYSISKSLIDGVQELLLKIGIATTVGINRKAGSKSYFKNNKTCYVLSYAYTSADHLVEKKEVRKQQYAGRVWCISTEYQTFVARRKGRPFVSGNSPYLLVIIDEALGVAPEMWEAIEGLHPYRILAIGNPLTPEGDFYKAFQSDLWHKISISCLDAVKWQAINGNIPGLVSLEWCEERAAEWGRNSPLYQARVLGEFPQEGTDTLIHLSWVDAARIKEPEEEPDALKILSCDVARYGEDHTAFVTRKGHSFLKAWQRHKIPTTETTGIIKREYQDSGMDNLVVDDTGVGGGITDRLREQGIGVYAFNAGCRQTAADNNKFKNLRSQFWWIAARKFEKGLYSLKGIADKEFEIIKNQLCSVKYKIESDGRIKVESKDDLKARGLVSPDLADALIMSEFGYLMGRESEVIPFKYR